MSTVAIGCKPCSSCKVSLAAYNQIQNTPSDYGTRNLGNDVGQEIPGGQLSACPEPEGNSRIKVAARDRPKYIGHRQNRQTKSQRNTKQSDTNVREPRG